MLLHTTVQLAEDSLAIAILDVYMQLSYICASCHFMVASYVAI